MKKTILLLVLFCILTGCNSNQDAEKNTESEVISEQLKISTNKDYEKELSEKDFVIEANYSIIENLNIATLNLKVKEEMTYEEIENLVKIEQEEFEKENSDISPIIKVYQNEKEVYSTLNEE